MKLAISNIAWENNELDEHLELISSLGCSGVEIAPSCIWPEPVNTNAKNRSQLKEKINKFNLEVVGLHALLFTRPELELFKTIEARKATAEYLKKLFRLCADLGGKTLVFGSAKNRRVGGQNYEECKNIAVEFFGSLMKEAQASGVILCLEPLSQMETDFITSSDEAYDFVKMVNHKNFGLHLDIKAMIDSKEDFSSVFAKYGEKARHLHVADSGLTPPGSSGFDHSLVGEAIRNSKYQGFISIEMRRGFGPSREVVSQAINYIKDIYPIEK